MECYCMLACSCAELLTIPLGEIFTHDLFNLIIPSSGALLSLMMVYVTRKTGSTLLQK